MTDEEKKEAEEKARKDAEERAKADADAGTKLDKILSHVDSFGEMMDALRARMDSMHSRMDAMEKKPDSEEEKERKDSEEEAKKTGEPVEVVADRRRKDAQAKKDAEEAEAKEAEAKAKKDAEEAEKEKGEKEKADAMEIADRIARVESVINMNDIDHAKFADAQARADQVYSMFGDSAPRPMPGESLSGYRRRLLVKMKDHSAQWKPVDLALVADSAAFEVAEKQIYSDAATAALAPSDLPPGEFRTIVRTDRETGQRRIEFAGRGSFVRQFKSPVRRVRKLAAPRQESR